MSSSPIADLSYRNYDGPLESPSHRWWVIARQGINLALKRRVIWLILAMAAWYYIGMIFVLFIIEQFAAAGPPGRSGNDPAAAFFARIVWKDQFLHGLSFAQISFLWAVLLLGAGAIANDNRANALLVYLSKPCTKLDYLIGKWFGLFIPLLALMTVPTLVFYGYGIMSYREQGFFSSDPWLLPKLLVTIPISAGFMTSIILGFSSLFNQGRLAGATFAGLYFLSNFFTKLIGVAYIGVRDDNSFTENAVSLLFYSSIDGINIGLTKAMLGTNGSPYFGIPAQRGVFVPAPPLWLMLSVIVGLSALSLFIAWRRIRAVEVVG